MEVMLCQQREDRAVCSNPVKTAFPKLFLRLKKSCFAVSPEEPEALTQFKREEDREVCSYPVKMTFPRTTQLLKSIIDPE